MIGITGFGPPMDYYIMNSYQTADAIIYAFEAAIRAGYHPNEVEQQIYADLGIDPKDLTASDKNRIQRRVEEIYRSFTRTY